MTSVQNKLEYALFSGCAKFFQFLGVNRARYFASVIAVIFYYLIPLRKTTVISNLKSAFPELKASEIKKIAFKNYRSIATALIEILCIPAMNSVEIFGLVDRENMYPVRRKYEERNGMMFFSAHFGNWEISAISAGLFINEPVHVLAKKQRNPYVTSWLKDMREKFGNIEITLGTSVRDFYKYLKDKRAVAVVADQRGPKDGVKVKFFGRDTYVFPGAASLAVKSNTPIMVAIIIRGKDGKYRHHFEEINYQEIAGEGDQKISGIMQLYMSILENIIRDNPEQWFWMHKIWKY